MQFSKLPTCTSSQATVALERLGCRLERTRGNHAVYSREREDGHRVTAPLVLGKKALSKGTLKSILTKPEIPLEDFLDAL